jgi:hypothetical protein
MFLAGVVFGAGLIVILDAGTIGPWWSRFLSNASAVQAVAGVGTLCAGVVAAIGLLFAGNQAVIARRALEKQATQAEAATAALEQQTRQAEAATQALDIQAQAARNATDRALRDSSRDCLWHFLEQLSRIDLQYDAAFRKTKAFAELESWPDGMFRDGDMQAVLDFYEGVAHMALAGQMEQDAAWLYFYSGGVEFWDLAAKYVEKERMSHTPPDYTFWEEYGRWVQSMRPYNEARVAASQLARQPAPVVPSS